MTVEQLTNEIRAAIAGETAALRRRVAELEQESQEHDASFDLLWKADQRAIKRWQEAHPGNENVWPDHADLCVWLIERVAELEATAGRLQSMVEAYEDCKRLWDAGMESLCEANHALKQEIRVLRAAAAEVAAGEKAE